jgi:endonuclease/exonuclease/phosphatase family metal-dependent hydrolase
MGNTPSQRSGRTLRILNYNVSWESLQSVNATIDMRHCNVNGRNVCAANIGRIVATSNADIICLQEIRRSNAVQWDALSNAITAVEPTFFDTYRVESSEPGPVAGIVTLYKPEKFTLRRAYKGDLLSGDTDIQGLSTSISAIMLNTETPLRNRRGRPYLVTVFEENLIVINVHFPQKFEMRQTSVGFFEYLNGVLRADVPEFTDPAFDVILCGDFNNDVRFAADVVLERTGKKFITPPFQQDLETNTCCDPGMYGAHTYKWNSDLVFTTIAAPTFTTIPHTLRADFTKETRTGRLRFMSDHLPVFANIGVPSGDINSEDAALEVGPLCIYQDTSTGKHRAFSPDSIPRSLSAAFKNRDFQNACTRLYDSTYINPSVTGNTGCAPRSMLHYGVVPYEVVHEELGPSFKKKRLACYRGYDSEYLGIKSLRQCEDDGCCSRFRCAFTTSGDESRCHCNANPTNMVQNVPVPNALLNLLGVLPFIAPTARMGPVSFMRFCKPHLQLFYKMLLLGLRSLAAQQAFGTTVKLLASALIPPQFMNAYFESNTIQSSFQTWDEAKELMRAQQDFRTMTEIHADDMKEINKWLKHYSPSLTGLLSGYATTFWNQLASAFARS